MNLQGLKRILVIEDAPDVRSTICEILEVHGWRSLSAADGDEGLAIARTQHPDLVLCDIRMPRMDGYSVLKELRANPGTASVPFIFLTGLSEKPNIRQGMELGADDYLVKPFTPQELAGAVESRFRKQAAMIELAEKKLNELRATLKSALPHEMVTPLNSILGFSALIMNSPEIGLKEAREYASHVLQAGERLQHLIESFVFYSQLEVALSDPERAAAFKMSEPLPIKERVTIMARRAAKESHRENDLSLEIEEASARIGQLHLDRIVRELVENALKFSPLGTQVQITSRPQPSLVELVIRNEGRGFTPEQIASIGAHLQFERTAQEQQGTGLGLAIVKRLVELYGGAFWIESTPEKMTSVHVQLPA